MKRFAYKAIGENGRTVEGEMQAADTASVIDNLQSSGYLPVATREISPRTLGLTDGLFGTGVTRSDVLDLTRELATMLDAGMPLAQSLATLGNLAHKTPVRDLLDRVRTSVEAGAPLSDALQASGGPFSTFYLSLVRSGEATGALELVLLRLAEYLQRAQQLRESVLSALLYPAILVCVAGGSLIVLLLYVVPQFEPMFADLGQALPLSTRIVVALANAVRHSWWALPLVMLGGYGVAKAWHTDSRRKAAFDAFLLRLPLFGVLIIRVELTRVFRTLGTLTSNGVTLLEAVRIVGDTAANRVIAHAFEDAGKKLEQGRGLSRPLSDSPWFPPLATQLIRVGEETGTLAPMLLKLADIYDDESQRAIKRMLALLEPLLILGLGLLIAFIVISILLAILGLNELVV